PEERKEILSFGFDGLLLKPFKELDLLTILGLEADTDPVNNAASELIETILSNTDEHIRPKVIKLFKDGTKKDLAELKSNVLSDNIYQTEFLLHRLAGRTAQMGEESIAFVLRKMEIDARSGEQPGVDEVEEIEHRLKQFIELLN